MSDLYVLREYYVQYLKKFVVIHPRLYNIT